MVILRATGRGTHPRKPSLFNSKEIGVLTFRALDEGLTLETSALESFYGGQFTFSYQLC